MLYKGTANWLCNDSIVYIDSELHGVQNYFVPVFVFGAQKTKLDTISGW